MSNEAESTINEKYPEMQYEIAGKEAYAREAPVRFQTNGLKFVAYPGGDYEQISDRVEPAVVTKERIPRTLTPQPLTFHFGIPGEPSSYWNGTGNHIVANGVCRCGRGFILSEQPAASPSV